jgi:hypothetical protein
MGQLVERWKTAREAGERNEIEGTLREMLQSEFSARLAAHEREIKELEEKVRQLRDRLNLRREKQAEIVDHRLQQILREAQGLGWGTEETGGTTFHFSNTPYGMAGPQYVPAVPIEPQPANGVEDSLFGTQERTRVNSAAELADPEPLREQPLREQN